MFAEEILIRMGVDGGAVTEGLKKIGSSVTGWASKVTGEIGSMITGPLGVSALIYGVISKLNGAMERASELSHNAEAKGVTTKFIQDIENVGHAAGLSSEQVEKMFNKFLKGLPAGANVEESFYQLADRLAGIHDPATRAKIAIEAFGRAGVEMLKILDRGSQGVKDLADQFARLSPEDIAAAKAAKAAKEIAKQQIEAESAGLNTQFIMGTAGLLSLGSEISKGNDYTKGVEGMWYRRWWDKLGSAVAKVKTAGSTAAVEEAFMKAGERQAAKEAKIASKEAKIARGEEAAAEVGLMVENELARVMAEETKLREEKLKLAEREQRVETSLLNIQLQKNHLYRQANQLGTVYPSVQELASNPNRYQREGMQLLWLQEMQKRARAWGDTGSAEKFRAQYVQLHSLGEKEGVLAPDFTQTLGQIHNSLLMLTRHQATLLVEPAD